MVNSESPHRPVPASGISRIAVEGAILLLRAAGKPLHTRDLLTELASRGVVVGGANPVANLSGFLSREKQRLVNSRTYGWSLREPHTADPTRATNANGTSHEMSEGRREVGNVAFPLAGSHSATNENEEDPRDPDLMRDEQILQEAEAEAERLAAAENPQGAMISQRA